MHSKSPCLSHDHHVLTTWAFQRREMEKAGRVGVNRSDCTHSIPGLEPEYTQFHSMPSHSHVGLATEKVKTVVNLKGQSSEQGPCLTRQSARAWDTFHRCVNVDTSSLLGCQTPMRTNVMVRSTEGYGNEAAPIYTMSLGWGKRA